MKNEKELNVKKIMAEERWNKRNARAYERYIKIAPKEEEEFWENTIVSSSTNKNAFVLDLGTGTGFLARILLKQGFKKVIGLDLSKYMLDVARRKASNAFLVRGDAENIPLKDSSVDLIVSRWVLWTLPHPWKALEEVVRVLKPNGCAILCDGELKNIPKLAVILGRIRSFFMDILIGWRFPTWRRVYKKLNPHLPRWNHEQISEKLRELGVKDIKIIHNINRRSSLLYKLLFYSEWEQFVVIFSKRG